jgi:uncharacterized protein YegP (UPF0339 family)
MKKPKVVFFKDADGKWRWSLIADNGRKLCTPGESFSNISNAERNFYAVTCTLNRNPKAVYK